MSKASELIQSIRLKGHSLELKDGKLLFTARVNCGQEERVLILKDLRENKKGVLAQVENEAKSAPRASNAQESAIDEAHATHCGGCYSVADGVQLHPPVAGYRYEERWK